MAKDPKQKSLGSIFISGILTENPVLRLILGTCPTLAVSTGAFNALGMGAAATVVLICSNAVISALRNVIPDKVRIPAYITIIAGFVTIIQMFVKGSGIILSQNRHFLNMGICHIAQSKIDCTVTSRYRHGRRSPFRCKLMHLPAASAC